MSEAHPPHLFLFIVEKTQIGLWITIGGLLLKSDFSTLKI